MTINAHAVALWLGIVGSAVGVYVPIHNQLTADHKAEVQQAQERQKRLDALNQRLANDETNIAALASQLPQDKRDLLNAIQAAQRNSQAAPQLVMYDKSAPKAELDVDCMKKGICVTSVAADAPSASSAEKGPQ